MRAGFGGKIGIPIAKDDNTSDTLNKKKYLSYGASIAYNGDYVLNVATLDSLSFDIFKAKAVILPNSYVQLKYQNNVYLPEAMLHGSMGMYITGTTASTDDANPTSPAIAEFKGIVFQGLNIKTISPYISATYLGYQGELKLANFPLSVESIAFRSISSTEAGIDLNVKITLQDGEFTGSTGLTLVGSMSENQGIRSWKYNRLTINSVAIHADIKGSFELDGYVNFMNNDPVYGNGWMGGISAKFKKGFNATVAVNAIFGRTNFRYWYIDGKASIGEGIGLILKVNGFGGGAYYRMKKNGFGPPTFGTTGVKYIPDSTAGLGVKAAVLFNIINSKVGNGEASFEIAFNKGGGLRYLGFFGFAKVMADLPIVGDALNYVGTKFQAIEDKLATVNIPVESLELKKMFQPSAAAKDIFPPIEQPGQTQLSAFLGIQYNFNESSLHATFDLYVNAGGGIIQGAASGNRAGWAVLHIDPDVWYLRAGTPTDKLGIKFNIGPVSVVTGAYFMLGQNMPAFPPPPPVVVSILNQAGLNYVPWVNSTFVSNGTGVALYDAY